MPKMKSNSAASKRIRVTGTGKLMHVGSGMRHNLENKSARRRRALSADEAIAPSQDRRMRGLLNH
ncbi:50S ribosomal protein L35 [uncultured Bifidobacterium sp.]|uniref:50S ribosomal protein L35 n=1 Tax=uncultured Bifidobacterium sp. TaxID=165187 RepID=UPI0028DB580D|nr:50S ribosomal protein L35 [uncultured Bifidobacterium sp.]